MHLKYSFDWLTLERQSGSKLNFFFYLSSYLMKMIWKRMKKHSNSLMKIIQVKFQLKNALIKWNKSMQRMVNGLVYKLMKTMWVDSSRTLMLTILDKYRTLNFSVLHWQVITSKKTNCRVYSVTLTTLMKVFLPNSHYSRHSSEMQEVSK